MVRVARPGASRSRRRRPCCCGPRAGRSRGRRRRRRPAGTRSRSVFRISALPGSCSPWTWKSPAYQPGSGPGRSRVVRGRRRRGRRRTSGLERGLHVDAPGDRVVEVALGARRDRGQPELGDPLASRDRAGLVRPGRPARHVALGRRLVRRLARKAVHRDGRVPHRAPRRSPELVGPQHRCCRDEEARRRSGRACCC